MKRLIPALAVTALLLVPRPAAALSTEGLLSLVAIPLAVAAVAALPGVPSNELGAFVALLNEAAVPPAQVVEVIRYVPVALVEDRDGFVSFLRTESARGIRGPEFATVVETRLRTYDLEPQVASNRTIWVDGDYIPPAVRTRIAERRTHPHGGPPGQLKKQLGLKTGAEVVHGTSHDRGIAVRVVDHGNDRRVVIREPKKEHHGKPAKAGKDSGDHGVNPGHGDGNGNGHGGGNGGGKGHGKKG